MGCPYLCRRSIHHRHRAATRAVRSPGPPRCSRWPPYPRSTVISREQLPFVISIESLLSENSTFVGRSLGFKFSLHYGDVLYIETSYGNDLLGEDVNVAARSNDLAQPNEIVVSQAALERMPTDYRARAGASESRQFKR